MAYPWCFYQINTRLWFLEANIAHKRTFRHKDYAVESSPSTVSRFGIVWHAFADVEPLTECWSCGQWKALYMQTVLVTAFTKGVVKFPWSGNAVVFAILTGRPALTSYPESGDNSTIVQPDSISNHLSSHLTGKAGVRCIVTCWPDTRYLGIGSFSLHLQVNCEKTYVAQIILELQKPWYALGLMERFTISAAF